MRTSDGTETRDSYVEKRSTPMIRNQPNSSSSAAGAASNSSVPARSYWTTRAGVPGAGGVVEPEVRRSSSTAAAKQSTLPPIVMQAVIGVNFIADHLKQQDEFNKVLVVVVSLTPVTLSQAVLHNGCRNCSYGYA